MWELLVEVILPVGGIAAVTVAWRYKATRRSPRKQRKLL